jgi:ATP-dependent helicase HrpA
MRCAAGPRGRLDALRSPALAPAVADIRAQLDALVSPGFLTTAGAARLPAVARYVKAIGRRLDKLNENAGRDAQQMAVVHRVQDAYDQALAALSPEARASETAREIRWQVEELRVSLFAQTMGTPAPVSERRVMTAIAALA